MIGYVTLGTNDFARAAAFYDALFAEMGGKRTMEFGPTFVVWGKDPQGAMLALTQPFDGKPASAGNGTMVAIAVPSRADVDRLYKKAIALGAKDEGPAGPRGDTFYAGYFRDLDGNKLNFFYMGK